MCTFQEVFREQDSQRGSVFALLFAVIVVFALVNIEKVTLGNNG